MKTYYVNGSYETKAIAMSEWVWEYLKDVGDYHSVDQLTTSRVFLIDFIEKLSDYTVKSWDKNKLGDLRSRLFKHINDRLEVDCEIRKISKLSRRSNKVARNKLRSNKKRNTTRSNNNAIKG